MVVGARRTKITNRLITILIKLDNKGEKNKKYAEAPSGFPGFETCLPLLLNEVNSGNLSLEIIEKIII